MAHRRGDGAGTGPPRPSPSDAVRERLGQSSVEYALVLLAFLAAALALGALWRAGRDGALARLATQAASHGLGGGIAQALRDIALF